MRHGDKATDTCKILEDTLVLVAVYRGFPTLYVGYGGSLAAKRPLGCGEPGR